MSPGTKSCVGSILTRQPDLMALLALLDETYTGKWNTHFAFSFSRFN